MAGDRDIIQIEHRTGTSDISIAATESNSGIFGMNSGCIAALYYAAPDVNTFLKAESKKDVNGTFRTVKLSNGNDWQYPDDGSNLTSAGCIGANSLADLVGLGEVRFVAQAAQTAGWTMNVRVSG